MPELNNSDKKDPVKRVNLRLGWVWIGILVLLVIALGIGRVSGWTITDDNITA